MVHSRHTTKVFDSDLQELARAIAEMGGLAERQIAEAIEALTTRDNGPAQRIVAADATIDAMQRNIEKKAIETIARRQPVAGDLREIVGILRIANEIERIGDLAKNIGKRIIAINGNGEDVSRKSMRGLVKAPNKRTRSPTILACRSLRRKLQRRHRDRSGYGHATVPS